MDLRATTSSAASGSSADFFRQSSSKGGSRNLWRKIRRNDFAAWICFDSTDKFKPIKTRASLSISSGSTSCHHRRSNERPIRTLLIDNYDSYTYNLYQLLCVINRVPPRVIKNDELSWRNLRALLREDCLFDSIVLSPGPGSPMRPRDIGLCLEVLQECVDIPILGVCLGHQALGYINGAKVVHAPEPVHGRLSEIEHVNCPLFKGIPSGKGSGFEVVRYHSLVLDKTSMPEDLVQTAWTVNSIKSASAEIPIAHSLEHDKDLIDGSYKADTVLIKDGLNSNSKCPSSSDYEKNAGLIMAISHKERPHYGVQFHPESVATAFGIQILENFQDITKKYWKEMKSKRCFSSDRVPKSREFSEGTRSYPLRIYWEKMDGIASSAGGSEGIFCRLFGAEAGKDSFWLDSALQPGGARFSYLGGKGGRLWMRLTYSLCAKDGSGGVLRIINDENAKELTLKEGFLDYLSSELESYTTSKEDTGGLPFDFWGGYIGYLGYELKVECGACFNQHKSKLPDACFFFVDRFIAIDHFTNDVYAVALYNETPNGKLVGNNARGKGAKVSDETQRMPKFSRNTLLSSPSAADTSTIDCTGRLSAKVWVKKTLRKIHELINGERDTDVESNYAEQRVSSSLSRINAATNFTVGKSKNQYMEDVKSCLQYIRDGESYELCLTTQLSKRMDSIDALRVYLTLRKMNPAPYAAWLNFGLEDVCVCCSSPERFLRLDQNGMIEAKPIKGTVPRGQSLVEDEAMRFKLQYSEKDRAENLMIVDLLRNDLGRVCEPGSVHVPKLMAVESYATVHTMVSTVRGIKRLDVSALDCVRASFPGGSMTGAPKLRSMELLDSLENSPRGVYSGSIGFFSVNSSFDLNIVIRTLVLHQGVASLGAGGAIVSLSDPADEYEEMLLKTEAPVRAVSEHEAWPASECRPLSYK